jgi:hypothetical protein
MSDFRLYEPSELGPDGYPPEWHELIKHEVRERARNRCVRCLHPYVKGSGEWSACDTLCKHEGPLRLRCWHGEDWKEPDEYEVNWHNVYGRLAPDASVLEARWRILTVHHLDGVKANCRWWNLAALCQRCHLQVQGRVRMERVYPWPHSEWFKPYVAGYYAWTYLGEDLDRPTVEARLGDLLALELAA